MNRRSERNWWRRPARLRVEATADGIELLCFDESPMCTTLPTRFLMGRFLDTAIALGTRIMLQRPNFRAGAIYCPTGVSRALPADHRADQAALSRDSFRRRPRLSLRRSGASVAAFLFSTRCRDRRALRDVFLRYEQRRARPTKLSAAKKAPADCARRSARLFFGPTSERLRGKPFTSRLPRSRRALAWAHRRQRAYRMAHEIATRCGGSYGSSTFFTTAARAVHCIRSTDSCRVEAASKARMICRER